METLLPRLSLVIAALAFLLIVAACGGGDDAKPTPFPTSSDPSRNIPKDQLRGINVVMAGSDWYKGDNNFVFGITNAKDEPEGGAQATATFYDLRDAKNPKPVFTAQAIASAPGVGPKVEVTHANGDKHVHGGENDNRVGYYVKVNFDHAGFWGIAVEAKLKDGKTGTSNIGFQVQEKASVIAVGQNAPKSDNLTKADVKDLSEIDSGSPPNDMHTVKIKDAIAKGRPVVVVFSTPAFCTSRFCGPVNEEVEALQALYKEKVDFVHIEIWRDFDKKIMNPAVKEWILRADGGLTEPWVYIVDSKGVVFERWEGPVAKNVMEPAVKAVSEGKTLK